MSNGDDASPNDQSPRPSEQSPLQRLQAFVRGNLPVVLLIGGAALVALLTAVLLWARAPDYRVLFSNINEADGGRIISELDARGVPYRFSQGGQALLVPSDQVHSLRMQLAEQGLPRGGNVGFELMEDQPFGISQFAEQVNFQRGLEGELSRSIESLAPVEEARVHIAMARSSVFVREREPAKASVVLNLFGGRSLSEGQVDAIRHFVASSVPELATEEVTIVDQRGRMLSRTHDPDKMDVTQLEYRNEVEQGYQRRIEEILEPLFGRDRVRARVSAQIDFSHREETSERYAPNQPPNEASVRSRQSNVSYTGDDDLVGGIPGALSNTPPGVAPSPIDLPEPEEPDDEAQDAAAEDDAEDDEEENGAAAPFAGTNSLQRDDVVNYEVDRNVAHVRQQRGQLRRISAAVVVDHRNELDADGEWQTVAPSEEELAQVERLAREAMGFSAERGDSIAVVSRPFSRQDRGPAPEWWQDPETIRLAVMLSEPLLWLLGFLLVYLLLLRPFIRHYTRPPQPPEASEPEVDTTVGDEDEDEDQDAEDAEIYEKPRRNKALGYQQKLAELREMAQRDPQIIAMIVRNWLKT
ncbi:MAG: flagellar basal-body MS-ring/collar protein FliF [Halochromatium sp.]|uniref:flagellar basal-body MS-ring/collar protein FliF n=1 Tax=Halochromatium sp. TaxID=2049430 RepID=UPI003978BC74